MSECTTGSGSRRGTPCITLAVLGAKLCQLKFWDPIRALVRIPHKCVRYPPVEKLLEVFILCVSGTRSLATSEQTLRADPVLLRAFGLSGCPEQSGLQDTLNACTAETVGQLEAACRQLFRQHGQAAQHDCAAAWLLLDVDVSGLPCGKRAAYATKGYFREGKNRRGRQLGRVLATDYAEVVVDRLYPGNVQLVNSFPELVAAAEETLELTETQRQRTLLRVDAGAGTVVNINWALQRGYQYHGKDYSAPRAASLAQTVRQWYPDPQFPGREVGWVCEASPYERMVYRIAVRCRDPRKPEGQAKVGVLASTFDPVQILQLTHPSADLRYDPATVLLAYVYFYDARGGGIELSFKGDKQGLGLTGRRKKRFEAQQVLTQLNALAHNVLIWARGWLAPKVPAIRRFGLLRLVRDVFHMAGAAEFGPDYQLQRLILNDASRLAHQLLPGLQDWFAPSDLTLDLGPP